MTPLTGRRELKKAATRLALRDAAMRLFLTRGFDAVTVREIAKAADVSPTTLMKHFPTKEALVFDRDDEFERTLVATLRERPILDALRAHLRKRMARVELERRTALMKLVRATPALADYCQRMWRRHEHVLARVLAQELGRRDGDRWCAAMAHFVLEAASLAEGDRHPKQMIDVALDILERGWQRSLRDA